jgi:hypothetical protein
MSPLLERADQKTIAGLRVVDTRRGRAVTGKQSAEHDFEALKANVWEPFRS